MSHQSVPARLNEKKASGPSPSPPVQSTNSGICIKQEYFEDQLLMTRTIKTESESPPNEHNIMQSIKVEVKEEHYDDQDCVVKCELDFDEGEQIKVKVEDVSSGQSVQLCKCVKKEEDDDGEYVMDCEICKVKMEMKEEFDQSGFETELGGNSGEIVQGCTRVKKEEEEGEVELERPNKIRRMNRVVENVQVGSPSRNVIPTNVEYLDDQMSTSSTNSITIEDHTQPSQPVTFPVSTPIVTPTQSSSVQHVNEPLRDELLTAVPRLDNVALVVDVDAGEFDREQIDVDVVVNNNSTLNQEHTEQETEVDDNKNDGDQYEEDEGDATIEQREDTNAGDDEQQVPAENFVKRIEPADELGNRFECDYRGCGKRMKQQWNLIRHIRSHTGEKCFKCTVNGCDRAFLQKNTLKVHLNTHSGTRPFACTWPRCEARFTQKINLTAHLRTHTGERPFECDQCDATFTQHNNLVTHLRTHTGARPFVCTWPDCVQAFTKSSTLKAHSIVHSNEPQFACNTRGCNKVYKRKDALLRHQKDKHN